MTQVKNYPTPSKIRYRLERVWLRRWFRKSILYMFSIIIFSIFSFLIFLLLNDWIRIKNIKNYINSYVFERPELSVSSLEIRNANSDLVNQIKAILQLSFPINSIQIDINNLQQIINNIDLVESSHIRIKDSGILVVEVNERKPVAVFREKDKLNLIDLKGHKISNIFSRTDRTDLPLIVGHKGNLHAREALEIYNIFYSYLDEIRGLIRIGERRWDIILKSDKRIKLPEKYPKKTLRKILNSNLQYLISSNDFSIIDLRFPNKIILRKKSDGIEDKLKEIN